MNEAREEYKGKRMAMMNRILGGHQQSDLIYSCTASEFMWSKSIMPSDCLIYSWISPIRK